MDFNNLGSRLLSGAIGQFAPSILKGAMKEYLGRLKVVDLVAIVHENKSLWGMLPDKHQRTFIDLAPRLGDVDWLTASWVLDSGRESAPAIYSLLTGWPDGMAWLENQVKDIRERAKGGVVGKH